MKKSGKTIVLSRESLELRFALLKEGRLTEYEIERTDDLPKAGSIYLGKIVNLEPSLQAAFVDIGADKNAFLHYHDMLAGADEFLDRLAVEAKNSAGKGRKNLSDRLKKLLENRKKKITVNDIPEVFKPGTELMVQVVKSPIGSKGARVSTDISLAGRFLVLMPYSDHIGLSTKIEGEAERTRLRKILSELDIPDGMGVICRTVGEGRKSTFFKKDLEILLDAWRDAEEKVEKGAAPILLYREPDLLERSVRDFMTDDISGIMVDDKESYRRIHDMVKRFGGRKMASMVSLYEGKEPIFDYLNLEDEILNVFQKEVPLPGGGWLCIEETEALISIDVNSGKGRKGAEQPEFILQVNLAAAEEIARQLKLRNVGGLVVLDFIDMKSARDRDEVYKLMKKLVKDDRAKTNVLPISRLGLMEMTRQREHESLQDTVYNSCPYCGGSGVVKSAMTMSIEIQRRLQTLLKDKKYKNIPIRVLMHPEVLARLKNEDSRHLINLEQKYKHNLTFRADPELHCEEFRFIDPDTGMEID